VVVEVFQEYCLTQVIFTAEGVVDTPKQQVPTAVSACVSMKVLSKMHALANGLEVLKWNPPIKAL
jgi:hypothetical protein